MRPRYQSPFWTAIRSVTLGLLVAAAGIGGSDVSMAALTGSRFGLMLLWAIVAGAFFKFVLNEGVARWQIATGQTLLQGACHRLGPIARVLFLVYLLPWTFAVGASLMSACAAVATAALTEQAAWTAVDAAAPSGASRLVLGLGHSLVAAALVLSGGYAVFKRVMSILTIAMVLLVVTAAMLTRPHALAILGAIFVPRLPLDKPDGAQWTIALFGGVGGTVTMLAYGYWMRAESRTATPGDRPPRPGTHRIDLGIAYSVTALFGIALTVLSADVPVHPSGSNLFQAVAARLSQTVGPVAGWIYLAGAWCAVWTCMLGVWQFIPLLFADFVDLTTSPRSADPPPGEPPPTADLARTRAYRWYLLALATLPVLGVWLDFADVQRAFGLLGSLFIPLLALALLVMNNRRAWVASHANGPAANLALAAALVVALIGLSVEFARLFDR